MRFRHINCSPYCQTAQYPRTKQIISVGQSDVKVFVKCNRKGADQEEIVGCVGGPNHYPKSRRIMEFKVGQERTIRWTANLKDGTNQKMKIRMQCYSRPNGRVELWQLTGFDNDKWKKLYDLMRNKRIECKKTISLLFPLFEMNCTNTSRDNDRLEHRKNVVFTQHVTQFLFYSTCRHTADGMAEIVLIAAWLTHWVGHTNLHISVYDS